MTINQPKRNLTLQIIAYAVFCCLSIFYFVKYGSHIFFYQEKSMLFQTSLDFLIENISQPGGFLVWLGELQTAFYFYPLAGALIISLEICLVVYIASLIGSRISGQLLLFVPFLIGAILFYMQTNYQFQALNLLAIAIQLLLFFLIVSFLDTKSGWFVVLLFPAWYFLNGIFSFILMFLIVFQLLFSKGKIRWLKISSIVFATVLFILVLRNFLLFDSDEKMLFFPYTKQNIGNQQILFLGTMLVVSILPVLFRLMHSLIQNFSIRKITVVQISPFLIVLITGTIVFSKYDAKDKHYFEVERLFYEQQFDKIIVYNEQHPSSNILTGFLNNIALAETGKLTDRLFYFPQSPDGRTLFLPWELSGEVLKRGGYFYYSLGMVNEAQRWAYEYMVMRGLTPEGLKMLIKTELINGNYKMAEKYISLLKQTVFYTDEAKKYELMLNNEPAIENDSDLGQKQRLKTKQDFFVLAENPPANLDLILSGDSTNLIAIQYKFAMLLLQKEFEQVTKLLPLLKKAGFTYIPQNIEEAVVAYSLLNLGKYPEFDGFTVKPETVINFNRYYQIFQQNARNKEQAEKALQEFHDTYWYHVFFR